VTLLSVTHFYAHVVLGCSRTAEGLTPTILLKLVFLEFLWQIRNPYRFLGKKKKKQNFKTSLFGPFFEKIFFFLMSEDTSDFFLNTIL
jgi:hypothetical protein